MGSVAHPPLPVSVPGPMGLDNVILQFPFGGADEAAVAFQPGIASSRRMTIGTKTLPGCLFRSGEFVVWDEPVEFPFPLAKVWAQGGHLSFESP